MPVTCPHCSYLNPDQARFCSRCGNKLQPGERKEDFYQGSPLLTLTDPASSPITKTPETPGLFDRANAGRAQRLLPKTELSGGRYRIEQLLAAGGMSTVYRAIDLRFNRLCAIKEMLDDFQNEEERSQAIEWFRREATLLLDLNHPCIPAVRDFFPEGDRHYLVMDFIEGRTLGEVLAKEGNVPGVNGAHGVSEARARSWAQQVCSVLTYLHNQQPPIIFRDLKPSNIMVTNQDEVKLIDFGIARTFQSQRQSNVIMTIGFAPPEQLHGIPEPRSDLYALGATLYRVLTHYDAVNNKPTIFSFPPLHTLRPDISPAFEQIVMKALAPSLEQRWVSAVEMERAVINLPSITIQPPVGGTYSSTGPATEKSIAASSPILEPTTMPGSQAFQQPVNTPQPVQSASAEPYPETPVPTPMGGSSFQGYSTSPGYYAETPPVQSGSYQPSAPAQPGPPNSSSPGLSSLFKAAGDTLGSIFSGTGKRKTKETPLSLFAITRATLENDDRALIGKSYMVEAGISATRPENFRAEPFDVSVSNPVAPLLFDILVHASHNIELTTEWHQRLSYYPLNSEPQLVQFTFKVVAPGQSSLSIDFYHQRRWLRTVRLTFDAIQQPQRTAVSPNV